MYLDQLTATMQDGYPIFPDPPVQTASLKGGKMKINAVTRRLGTSTASVYIDITNTDTAPLARVCLSLPILDPNQRHNMAAFGTVKPDGWRLAAPCADQPLRAWWMELDGVVVSIIPNVGDARCLCNLWPKLGKVHLWIDKAVMPGETLSFSVDVYERAARVLPSSVTACRPRYISTAWPMGQANLDDPKGLLGYKEPFADSISRLPSVRAAGLYGLQCWGQQGYTEPSYSPDMLGINDGSPPMVDFVRHARVAGLRLGYTCRPGADIRAADVDGRIQRAASIDPFLAQLRIAMGWGVHGLYCDSFGSHNGNVAGCLAPGEPTDRDFAIAIRRVLAEADIAAPCMAELSTEATLDLMGVYLAVQWNGSGFQIGGKGLDGVKRGSIDTETWRAWRAANPALHATAQIFAPEDRYAEAIDFCGAEGVVPMVRWTLAEKMAPAIAAYTAKYVDPATGFRE